MAANSRPYLLPDGNAVVFQSGGTASSARLSLVEIGSGEVVDLGIDGADPRYADAGYLLFGDKDQALQAVPFDLETHRVTGEPAMVPDVLVCTGGATQFAVSQNGTAVYARSGGTGQSASELVIVDSEGRGSALPLGPGTYSTPRFLPDGHLLAYVVGGGLWVWNRDSGANARVATDATGPWSRDGRSIYFGSHAGARVDYDVFRMNADGSGERERILDRPGVQVPLSESADESRLLVLDAAPDHGVDLRVATLRADTTVFSDDLVAPWSEGFGEISPDGTRVAYTSEETGAAEVYLRSFPDAGRQILVSDNGGTAPLWAPDGASVYYLRQGDVWRAELTADGVGERRMLFQASWAPSAAGGPVANWDIAPDGRSFVLVRNTADSIEGGPPPF